MANEVRSKIDVFGEGALLSSPSPQLSAVLALSTKARRTIYYCGFLGVIVYTPLEAPHWSMRCGPSFSGRSGSAPVSRHLSSSRHFASLVCEVRHAYGVEGPTIELQRLPPSPCLPPCVQASKASKPARLPFGLLWFAALAPLDSNSDSTSNCLVDHGKRKERERRHPVAVFALVHVCLSVHRCQPGCTFHQFGCSLGVLPDKASCKLNLDVPQVANTRESKHIHVTTCSWARGRFAGGCLVLSRAQAAVRVDGLLHKAEVLL